MLGAGEEVYKAKCALCHDSGATNAPRVGRAADWKQRVEKGFAGLLRSATQGVANSAMLPRAGFPELSDAELSAAVRYMVGTLGLQVRETAAPQAAAAAAPLAPVSQVDDVTLVANVAEALRQRLAPASTVDTSNGTRIAGILVEASRGAVALKGVVNDTASIAQAEQAARGVPGVREIENRLVPADLFEHD